MKKKLILLTVLSLTPVCLHAFKFKVFSSAPKKITNVVIHYGYQGYDKTVDINAQGCTVFMGNKGVVRGLTYTYNGVGKSWDYPERNAPSDPMSGCINLYIDENGDVSRIEQCNSKMCNGN